MTTPKQSATADNRYRAVRGGAWYHTVDPDVRPSYSIAHAALMTRHVDVCFRTVQTGCRQPFTGVTPP